MRLPIVARSVAASVARHPTHGTIQGPGSCAFPPSQPAPYIVVHARQARRARHVSREVRVPYPSAPCIQPLRRRPRADTTFARLRFPQQRIVSRQLLRRKRRCADKTGTMERRSERQGHLAGSIPAHAHIHHIHTWYSPPPKTQHQPASPPPPPLASTQ